MALITTFPSAKIYGAVGDGTTDDTAALTAWLTAISGKAGYLPAGTYMCNNLGTIPASTIIYGYGAILKKNANGDLASLADRVEIYGLKVHGNGGVAQGNYTGKGFVITAGNDQKLNNVEILFCKDRCLSINKDVGIRFAWIGGQVFRSDAITDIPILLGANGTPQESNGDRLFSGLFAGGNWLIDVQYSQTTIISSCDFVNMNFHANASKTLVNGNRIATLGSDLTINGTQCNVSNNIIAGGITISSNASSNIIGTNTLTDGSTITDSSGNRSNSYDKVETTYAPVWGSGGTQPAIGNGTITGKYSVSRNGWVEIEINQTMGSTTTYGTGSYTWSLPSGYTASSNGIVKVGSAYCNAGGTIATGTSLITSGGTFVQAITSGNANVWEASLPGTWANGNILRIQIRYPIR